MGPYDDPRNPFRRRQEPSSWLDTMQVCENGHIITDSALKHPQYQKKRCPSCGAATIMACKKCSKPIPGHEHLSLGAAVYTAPRPQFCDHCGEPFPWTSKAKEQPKVAISSNKVFVVHGHAEGMKQAAARVLTTLGLDPIILHEQPNQGRTIIEKFVDFADVGFAVVLLSGDDMAYPASVEQKKAKPKPRARQNVVMELGFFLGKLGRGKVFPLYKQADEFELPSDLQGVIYTAFDAAGSWRFALAQELKAAGYNVDANKLLRF